MGFATNRLALPPQREKALANVSSTLEITYQASVGFQRFMASYMVPLPVKIYSPGRVAVSLPAASCSFIDGGRPGKFGVAEPWCG